MAVVENEPEDNRPDRRAYVKARRDDAEHASGGALRHCLAHHHVARGLDNPGKETRGRQQHDDGDACQRKHRDQQHKDRTRRKTECRNPIVVNRAIGDEPAGKNAEGRREEIAGQRDIRRFK